MRQGHSTRQTGAGPEFNRMTRKADRSLSSCACVCGSHVPKAIYFLVTSSHMEHREHMHGHPHTGVFLEIVLQFPTAIGVN